MAEGGLARLAVQNNVCSDARAERRLGTCPQRAIQRELRDLRRRHLGPTASLCLVGRIGSEARDGYLTALAATVASGVISRRAAIKEIQDLSSPWMRLEVQRRLRLRPFGDPHTLEHWLWKEWHEAVEQFDPERVASFSGYVALRLRMAQCAAGREDDPLPRRVRDRLKMVDQLVAELHADLGRPLTHEEHGDIQREVVGQSLPPLRSTVGIAELDLDQFGGEPDPADEIERRWLSHAVREVVSRHTSSTSGALLAWLDGADEHGRPPSRRLTAATTRLRTLLTPLRDAPTPKGTAN